MRSYSFGMESNFGDLWTSYAVWRLCDRVLEPVDPLNAELFGVGSIASDVPQGFRGHIFGSGLMHSYQSADFSQAQVWCLRGHLTAERVKCPSAVVGDPVLLSEWLVPEYWRTNRYRLGVIPHYVDKQHPTVRKLRKDPEVCVIDIQSGVWKVLRAVAQCQQIVSSSLHGLVVADALGIPNQWVQLSDAVAGDGFKFHDYYSVFGLHMPPLREIPSEVSAWDRPNLAEIKTALQQVWARFEPVIVES